MAQLSPSLIYFIIKGFCKAIQDELSVVEVDTEYVFIPRKLLNGKPVWIGTKNTIISFNTNISSWVLCHQFSEECYASYKTQNKLPLGRHIWRLRNKYRCKKEIKGSSQRHLKGGRVPQNRDQRLQSPDPP